MYTENIKYLLALSRMNFVLFLFFYSLFYFILFLFIYLLIYLFIYLLFCFLIIIVGQSRDITVQRASLNKHQTPVSD